MAQTLSSQTLYNLPSHVEVPKYDRTKVTPGYVHIGAGNFHRMHQEVVMNRVLALPNHDQWGVIGAEMLKTKNSQLKSEGLKSQDGLYTSTEFGPGGSSSTQVIGSMVDYIHVPDDPFKFLEILSSPNIRIVGLTITEGGYNIDEATGEFRVDAEHVLDDLKSNVPKTAFGFITEALNIRRKAGISPFTIMSCDNLRHNGDTARKAVVGFAKAKDPSLAEWIDQHATFPNSMVDRIVPFVTDQEYNRLNVRSGIQDHVPVYGESFLQWVIEDKFCNGRPDLGAVGVELRHDVSLFETKKGRILNAGHSVLAYPAILSGIDLVYDAMNNEVVYGFLTRFLGKDVLPILQGPPGVDLRKYADVVLERFGNAAIEDQTLRLGHFGSAKIPVFCRETIETLVKNEGELDRAAFFLACFSRYLAGVDDNGKKFDVVEPALSGEDWEELNAKDGLGVLRTSVLSPLQLANNENFVQAFLRANDAIAKFGVQRAIKEDSLGRW